MCETILTSLFLATCVASAAPGTLLFTLLKSTFSEKILTPPPPGTYFAASDAFGMELRGVFGASPAEAEEAAEEEGPEPGARDLRAVAGREAGEPPAGEAVETGLALFRGDSDDAKEVRLAGAGPAPAARDMAAMASSSSRAIVWLEADRRRLIGGEVAEASGPAAPARDAVEGREVVAPAGDTTGMAVRLPACSVDAARW